MYSLSFAHISMFMFNFDPARFHSLIHVPCGLIVPCAANPIKFCNLTGLGRSSLRNRSQLFNLYGFDCGEFAKIVFAADCLVRADFDGILLSFLQVLNGLFCQFRVDLGPLT